MATTEVGAIIEQLSSKLVIPANQLMESISKIGMKNFVEVLMAFIVIIVCSLWLYFISDKIKKTNSSEERNELETLGIVMTIFIFIGLVIALIYKRSPERSHPSGCD